MDDRPYRLLLHGLDTLQCAYYLHVTGDSGFDFRELAVSKEALQHRKSKDPEMIEIGEELFHLYPYGTSSGYPFLLSSGDFKIECGEFNNPSFFVIFKSQALWRSSAYELYNKVAEIPAQSDKVWFYELWKQDQDVQGR